VRVLVTGGGTIGTACALAIMGERGYAFCPSRTLGFDLTKARDRLRAMEEMECCDILINCVGGGGRFGTDDEVMTKNVTCMREFTEWALPYMVTQGWGRVVTISSIHGREYGSRPIFMAAKAAQIAYMKGMSKDRRYVRRGITFNTVCPGNVYVEGKPRVDEDALPMGRMGTAQEVAKLVAFLCSNDAGWINGASLTIDGGESNAI
jgi:3-oxoacyl-[acyl-carrier protein] reductase